MTALIIFFCIISFAFCYYVRRYITVKRVGKDSWDWEFVLLNMGLSIIPISNYILLFDFLARYYFNDSNPPKFL